MRLESTPVDDGRILAMMSSVDELARNAAKLPDDQKLALANRILEQAEGSKSSEVEAIWDQEIRNRVRAYDDTRPSTRAASDVFSDLDFKLTGFSGTLR